MTSAEWHSTLFQFIGLILSLVTFIGSIVAIYYEKTISRTEKSIF